jgi:hypothetical protein
MLLMQQLQLALHQQERQVSSDALFMCVLFPTCVHHQLECLGFTWYLLMVVPRLHPFHNML